MLQRTSLTIPSTLSEKAVHDISGALMLLLSDVFALYLKSKNFHWHMSGPHFRDYHLMLDDQSDQIFAMTDAIAERARRSAARPCARSGRSRVFSALRTTTLNTSNRSTC
jgi:starvation-inducible DNA-binding protein